MRQRSRSPKLAKVSQRHASKLWHSTFGLSPYRRPLRVETLEDRRLLTQLISNGSLESGSAGWAMAGNFYADVTHPYPHTGAGYAYLSQPGGNPGNNLVGSMYQQFTVPAAATSVTLTYWYNITTTETSGIPNDVLNVTIQNSSGQYLAGVGVYSNLNSGTVGVYSEASYDLSSFKGQTIRLNLFGTTNGSYPTTFRIDDLSVVATVPAATPSITTVSPTSMPPSTNAQPIKVYGSNIDTSSSHLLFTNPQGQVYSSANHPTLETRVSSAEFDYQVDNNSDTGTWKVQVQNPDGQVSNMVTFTVATPVSAPTVSTTAASSVTAITAVMNGTVNPNGASTSAYFQYGTTTSYGYTGQAQTGITTTTNVQTTLTGLAPSTTYHYRLVASNSGGTSYGSDMSFITMNAAVTLTLYVRAGSTSGPLLSGALVTGQDAVGNTFSQTTNGSGYVVLSGIPGMWQFAASDSGYPTNKWSQNIATTGTKTAFLVQQVVATTERLAFIQSPTDGTPGSTITPAVTVAIKDSNNNIVTSDHSNVTLTLSSGTLGGTATVAAVNGVATFGNLTVSVAGTYTLKATDGGDAFATSTSFSVGNSPRDALIQAVKDFNGAVAAYQAACINVFAAADVPLAELIHTNNQGLFSDLLTDLANNAAQDWVQGFIGLASPTGPAVEFLQLVTDMLTTWSTSAISSIADWQLGVTGDPTKDEANLKTDFGNALSDAMNEVGSDLTQITNRIASLSPSLDGFPAASVTAALKSLTRQVGLFTPRTGGSSVGEVGWAMPGAGPNIA